VHTHKEEEMVTTTAAVKKVSNGSNGVADTETMYLRHDSSGKKLIELANKIWGKKLGDTEINRLLRFFEPELMRTNSSSFFKVMENVARLRQHVGLARKIRKMLEDWNRLDDWNPNWKDEDGQIGLMHPNLEDMKKYIIGNHYRKLQVLSILVIEGEVQRITPYKIGNKSRYVFKLTNTSRTKVFSKEKDVMDRQMRATADDNSTEKAIEDSIQELVNLLDNNDHSYCTIFIDAKARKVKIEKVVSLDF